MDITRSSSTSPSEQIESTVVAEAAGSQTAVESNAQISDLALNVIMNLSAKSEGNRDRMLAPFIESTTVADLLNRLNLPDYLEFIRGLHSELHKDRTTDGTGGLSTAFPHTLSIMLNDVEASLNSRGLDARVAAIQRYTPPVQRLIAMLRNPDTDASTNTLFQEGIPLSAIIRNYQA